VTDWPVRHYDSLDSTNEEAKRLARQGEHGPLWIVAREQSAGRGRRGRVWVSDDGNLFATLLLEAPANGPELCFVAGLAVADAVAALAPAEAVALKWPNDLLLAGKKLAGILLEQEGRALAIGIGINLAQHPENTEFPAISVRAALGAAPAPVAAFDRLASAMGTWYEVWRAQGFAPIRDAWLARAAGLGETIRARLGKGEVVGVFEDLDRDGALLLREAGGRTVRVTAADVFFPSATK
jgi:BirA family biotin operon repressor/biotin-[acetyl-CoA-carboxylase] ligase